MNRDELLKLMEDSFVPVEKWGNRDTPQAQRQLGDCYALIKAGCDYSIREETSTLWINVIYPTFSDFEWGRAMDHPTGDETFYLPTRERLKRTKGGDWY